MYSRRNNIRIYGIPEPPTRSDDKGRKIAEDTTGVALDIFRNRLGVDYLSDRDICRSHRVGRIRDGKPRAIIVKFIRHVDKDAIIHRRSALKGTKVVIKEDLTKERYDWIQRVQDAGVDHRSVWSYDGVVTVLIEGKKKYIKSSSDLEVVLCHLRKGA